MVERFEVMHREVTDGSARYLCAAEAIELGFNVIWFGVLMLMILEISLATPPFGLLLFVVKGAAPDDTTMRQIIVSVAPFIAMAMLVVVILIAFPGITLLLPNLISR